MLKRIFPFIGWFDSYGKTELRLDFLSGLTVAMVLIPQSMAYAQLAGLPAYYGLYASFLPPAIAVMFGSSRQLATGPVAMVSLMTATALEPLATAGGEAFIAYAIMLALLVGLFQLSLGVLRLGLVVNFLSHPVVNGFTSAAALIIATSQLSKIFGVTVDKAPHHYETIYRVIEEAIYYTHWPSLALALLAFVLMYGVKKLNPKFPGVLLAVVVTTVISFAMGFENNSKTTAEHLNSRHMIALIDQFNAVSLELDSLAGQRVEISAELLEDTRTHGELSAAVHQTQNRLNLLSLDIEELKVAAEGARGEIRRIHLEGYESADGELTFCEYGQVPEGRTGDNNRWRLKVGNKALDTAHLTLIGGGAVVGSIPEGLPGVKLPVIDFTVILTLFPMATIIALLGFMEAISIAKAMAARTGQRLDANQELIGQGLSNIVGATVQSYTVSGSFSRSAVNIQAGARTGMSSVFSSLIVGIVLLLLTPLLYHLPQATLAVIIMMAVIGLLNVGGFIHAWKAQKYDGIIGLISFVSTLVLAPHIEYGIMIGVGLSLGLYLVRNIKPHIALLSMFTDGTYRNAERHGLQRCKHIAVVRFQGSLIFANVAYLEEQVLDQVRSMPELRWVVLVGNGINELDASGEEKLSELVDRLRGDGHDIALTGLNDSVLDVMRRTLLYDKIGEDHLFRNATRALEAIHDRAHFGSDEKGCPLYKVRFRGLPVADRAKRGDKKPKWSPKADSDTSGA